MTMNMRLILIVFLIFMISMASALQVGFYRSTCPQAESIVLDVITKHFTTDRQSVTAAFLRLNFHDCWVNGCDASILINSTTGNKAEKDNSGVNLTVRGYNIVEEAKARLEAECPSTVSCADIIAIATRDSVALAGGLNYTVPTGRRDGLVSQFDQAIIPSPSISVSSLTGLFSAVLGQTFSMQDVVVLLGAHTVGVAHCNEFESRLSDKETPMDPTLRGRLTGLCNATLNSSASLGPGVPLDQGTPFVVDNSYYAQIAQHKGIMQIDQALALDKTSGPIVTRLRKHRAVFNTLFADALVKLGNSLVLEGTKGEIRKQCSSVNS